jgi:V/A-type H+-transporting ATPase subunit I
MIVTGKMRHLTGAVLDSDSNAVTRELLRLGVLDFVSLQEMSPDWRNELDPVYPREEQRQVAKLRERIETFFAILDAHPATLVDFFPEDEGYAGSLDEAERRLDKVASAIQRVREEQKAISQELNRTKELQRHLDGGGDSLIKQPHRFLSIRYGLPSSGREEEFRAALGKFPCVYLDSGLLMTLKRDEAGIAPLLERFGWREIPAPVKEEHGPGLADAEIERKTRELEAKNDELEKKAREIVEGKKDELLSLWKGLRIRELSETVRGFFGKTARTFIFAGWVPASHEKELDGALRRVTDNRCHLEWLDPFSHKDGQLPKQIPVIMNNPKWLRPFEKLVTNYAIPAYGTVDPTIFVAVFYCAMFGLMFGDVGHGLVVFLIGLFGKLKAKKSGKQEHFLFSLFRWCGGSAMVAGALFGSWFGVELLPPLWFDYHGIISGHSVEGGVQSIYDILLITIYFGIAVIGVGFLLNFYNRIVKRDWVALFFDKGGLLGGWLYAAGTWSAFYFVRHDYRQLPDSSFLALFLGLPALLMIVKPVIEWHYAHRGERFGLMSVAYLLMEWLVELLEVFSGYLSNTLSFMRVAGLGIAHVSLLMAFFQIADMTAGSGGYTIWSYIILLLGNVLIIGLEGLSAGIQSLRLNYYEFFSKYFDGTGRAYAPVSLKH